MNDLTGIQQPKQLSHIEEEVLMVSQETEKEAPKMKINLPNVKATANIIWDAPFTTTDYYKYALAIQTGLSLKWTSQAVCF